MSEYEIFNDDEEVVPEPKPIKEKKVRSQKSGNFSNFFKEAFGLNFLSLTFSIISILFSMLVGFIPLVSNTTSASSAVAAFFFIGFALALAGLIIEVVKMIKEKKFSFSVQIFIVLVALIVSCIVLPSSFIF